MKKLNYEPIAIVGMGCVFPGAFNKEHFWESLKKGETTFTSVQDELWNNNLFYSSDRRAPDKYFDNVVSYPKDFKLDPSQFNVDPNVLNGLSRRDGYIYSALNECLKDIKKWSDSCKFYVGNTATADSLNYSLLAEEIDHRVLSVVKDQVLREKLKAEVVKAVGVEYPHKNLAEHSTHRKLHKAVLDLTGKSHPIAILDAACASSLYTADQGIMDLVSGTVELAICGGISFTDPVGKTLFCRLGGSSRFGVFPFQSRADGTVFGEAAGFVALKKLSKALADGDQVYAVIRGLGTSSDGKGKSIYAPNSNGQVLAMARGYQNTDVQAETVQYIEAHGTGTPAGDVTEFNSLAEYFGSKNLAQNKVGLGSVKGLFGHLGWCAGVASIIKMALCLKNKTIVAQPNFEALNPKINLAQSPFYINTKNLDWPENGNHPRRAGINGFGFGGTNAHLVMEEFAPSSNELVQSENNQKEKIVLVGLGTVFPRSGNWEKTKEIINSGTFGKNTFDDQYKPNNIKYRIIDRSAQVIDKSQFMALDATQEALKNIQNEYPNLKDHIGAFFAQHSATHKQLEHMIRIYADALRAVFADQKIKMEGLETIDAVKNQFELVYQQCTQPNEDSLPGNMPNVHAGRLCNVFDLKGPNYTINGGLNSLDEVLRAATNELQFGKCKLAVVSTANAAASGAFAKLWSQLIDNKNELAEGAATFLLMTESEANIHNIKIKAYLDFEKEDKVDEATNYNSPLGQLMSAPELPLFLKAIAGTEDGIQEQVVRIKDEFGNTKSLKINTGKENPRAVTSKYFFIDDIISQNENSLIAKRKLDENKDNYLEHHLVRGKPTLPGTFMIEIAAQAAKTIFPVFKIIELKEIKFLKFIRSPMEIKISAITIESADQQKTLKVQILSDLVAKTGLILQKDIVHFECQVLVSLTPPAVSLDAVYKPTDGIVMEDPYHKAGAEVYLSGLFKTITKMTTNGNFNFGEFDLAKSTINPNFDHFVLCPLFLDGALRTSILNPGQQMIPAVPTGISSIKVFNEINDLQLAQKGAFCIYDRQEKKNTLVINGHPIIIVNRTQTHEIEVGSSITTKIPDEIAQVRIAKGSFETNFLREQKKKTNEAGRGEIKNEKTFLYADSLLYYKNVFVTGATGLVGSQLIAELLMNTNCHIYCLVRATSVENGLSKLQTVMQEFGLWNTSFKKRITIIRGDLAKQKFGLSNEEFMQLSEKVDHIFHSGAKIAWTATYDELVKTNVNGCETVLEMAKGKPIPISYMSTISVNYGLKVDNYSYFDESSDSRLCYPDPYFGGYVVTKWRAEKVMADARDQGLPVKIFRLGVLCGSLTIGFLDKGYFIARLIKTIAESGFGARSYNYWDLTPADFATKAILFLSNPRAPKLDYYHIMNPTFVSSVELSEMISKYGYNVNILPLNQFIEKTFESAKSADDHPLRAFSDALGNTGDNRVFLKYFSFPLISSSKTYSALRGSGIVCKKFDFNYFRTIMDYLVSTQFVKAPQSGSKDTFQGPKVSKVPEKYKEDDLPTEGAKRYIPSFKFKPLKKNLRNRIDRSLSIFTDMNRDMTEKIFQRITPSSPKYYYSLDDLNQDDFALTDKLVLIDLKKIFNGLEDPAIIESELKIHMKKLFNFGKKLTDGSEEKLIFVFLNALNEKFDLHPCLGAFRGFLRALGHELPNRLIRGLFLSEGFGNFAEVSLQELSSAARDPIIYYIGWRRFESVNVEKSIYNSKEESVIKPGDVVLFTGGGRGIGAYLSKTMGEAFPGLKLAIVGRSDFLKSSSIIDEINQTFGVLNKETFIRYKQMKNELKESMKKTIEEFQVILNEKELVESIREIKKTGVEVEYFVCDVTDKNSVRNVVNAIELKFRKIDHVIHCAGTDQSKLIKNKSEKEFFTVLDIKISGFLNLMQNLDVTKLKTWINFGSIVSFYGNDGQTDYCAGNDFLNTVSQFYAKKMANTRFLTLNWGAWADVGMINLNNSAEKVLISRGWQLINPADGAAWFKKEIGHTGDIEKSIFYFTAGDRDFFEQRVQKRGA